MNLSKKGIVSDFYQNKTANDFSQVEMLLEELLSLAVIDQITKEDWAEGWHMEEEEVEGVKVDEKGNENGIEKVEQGKDENGGKKEELGRIPLSVPRYFIDGSCCKRFFFQIINAPSRILNHYVI